MPFLSWLRISELCAASDAAVLHKCCPPSQNATTSSSLHKAVSHLPGVALQRHTEHCLWQYNLSANLLHRAGDFNKPEPLSASHEKKDLLYQTGVLLVSSKPSC